MSDGHPHPYRVVIADDVEDLRTLYRLVLEASGSFEIVAEAATGVDAVALATAHHPDLVLLDLAMPGMDGVEALPRILQGSPSSKVVVLSAFGEDALGAEVRSAGASAFIEKGVTPTDLVDRLARIMHAA